MRWQRQKKYSTSVKWYKQQCNLSIPAIIVVRTSRDVGIVPTTWYEPVAQKMVSRREKKRSHGDRIVCQYKHRQVVCQYSTTKKLQPPPVIDKPPRTAKALLLLYHHHFCSPAMHLDLSPLFSFSPIYECSTWQVCTTRYIVVVFGRPRKCVVLSCRFHGRKKTRLHNSS